MRTHRAEGPPVDGRDGRRWAPTRRTDGRERPAQEVEPTGLDHERRREGHQCDQLGQGDAQEEGLAVALGQRLLALAVERTVPQQARP
ncbi:MAG TPA: hypothetical protein VK988_05730, partial [Acidimicrobiales bacterium]|nr:hypothetical protein [Acidimicrobiales bacterium]